jgi:Holliday junction DNA helicase RuvA
MIGRLRGVIAELEGNTVLLDVHGVGYEILVPDHVAFSLGSTGEATELLVRQIVREDSLTLYGFTLPLQRRLFDLLLGVSGCGPKSALSLIGQLGEETVCGAILSQDAKTLSRASGIGARTAERIIVELKDKIAEQMATYRPGSAVPTPGIKTKDDELVEALLALGYRRTELDGPISVARERSTVLSEQIRLALAELRS